MTKHYETILKTKDLIYTLFLSMVGKSFGFKIFLSKEPGGREAKLSNYSELLSLINTYLA